MSLTKDWELEEQEYRLVLYKHDGRTVEAARGNNPSHLDELLVHHVESGYATGGHLESYVKGIGWVLED